jgi:predicted PurR-regulated permease PerM
LMYAGIGLVFALLLALYFVYQIRVVVLVFLMTLLFSIVISGPVDYLARRGLRRGWGTLVVLGGLTLVLVLAISVLAPIIGDQAEQLIESFPTLLSNTQELAGQLQNALGLQTEIRTDSQQLLDSAQSFFSEGPISTALSVGASVANLLSLGAVVLIATIYVVARPAPLINGFVAFFPAGQRQRVRGILQEMYKAVQRWFLGQLTSMLIVGVLFTVALFLLGIPFALLLGILSGLLAFIPFIGPVVSVILPILLALVDEPVKALWVILTYLVVQSVESNVVQPVVMSRAVSLHPAVVVFALLIMGTLFGLIGVLLAVRLVATLHVLVHELWIKRMDALGTDPNPPEGEPPTKQRAGRLRRAAEALSRRS